MNAPLEQPVRFLVVGINHRTAPLEVRESLAFNHDKLSLALRDLKSRYPGGEFVILSTCNRVELYVARGLHQEPSVHTLIKFLGEFHKVAHDRYAEHIFQYEDRAAIEHLYHVAASLDSMVLGETQILAQVKAAYQAAAQEATVGKIFHAMFQRATAAAKEVHDKTHLASGRLSIASVAVDLVKSVFDRFDDKTVLCIGAGKMATLVLKHLSDLKPKRVHIANRSVDRAAKLAAEFSASASGLEHLDQLLAEADIILTSTGASEPIITTARFRGLLKARRYRPAVIVDIAVPRDVEAAVGELDNVYLYNIDNLESVAAGNRSKRDAHAAEARGLLTQHIEEFLHWHAARDVGPLVKALYEQSYTTARGELDVLFQKHGELTPEQRAAIEKAVHRLVGKMLHEPVKQLTQQAEATARPMLTTALRKLFGLEPHAAEASPQPPAAPAPEKGINA